MKFYIKLLALFAIVVSMIITVRNLGYGQIGPGQKAPIFELADINGKRYNLATMENHLMVILYFFDVAFGSSQEGLLALDDLAKRFSDTDLKIWAITRSAKDKVKEFLSKNPIDYPFLLDTSKVSDLYQARFVLPTICILGPKLQILDYIQGGGEATEIMLMKLAEKELQRQQPAIAIAISETVTHKNPQNLEAIMLKGYAEIKGGDLDAAEKTFRNLSQSKGQGDILGKEGLVSVYAARGQYDKVLKLAEEVEKMAPDRGHVNAIKADILYIKGKKNEAQAEYQKAARKKSAVLYQKAVTLNKLGRLQASMGNLPQARELYDQAMAIDPYYIDAAANKGETYEKEGKWDEALSTYQQALSMDKDVDKTFEMMKKANIAFNVPESMNLIETIDITLLLDLTKSIEELAQLIESKGKKEGSIIKVTSRMGADLKGSNFKITAITEKIQFVTSKNITEWKWEIKPIVPGDHNIYLSLNAYVDVKGHDTPKTLQTFRKTIKIKVTWTKITKDFFQSNWQWLWTSLFIPITIWLWRQRKKNYDVDNKKESGI